LTRRRGAGEASPALRRRLRRGQAAGRGRSERARAAFDEHLKQPLPLFKKYIYYQYKWVVVYLMYTTQLKLLHTPHRVLDTRRSN